MGLQHSTERPYRKEYEEDKYDSMSVREDVEKGDDMIARTLVISVKKSPRKRASPMKRKTTPMKKTTPKRKASPVKRKTGKPRKTSGKKK